MGYRFVEVLFGSVMISFWLFFPINGFLLPNKKDEFYTANFANYERYLNAVNIRASAKRQLYADINSLKKEMIEEDLTLKRRQIAEEEAKLRQQLKLKRATWHPLRGIEFERRLAELFEDGGCSVDETSVSGDGGVDLIIKTDRQEYWVQAKGHAALVGVTVVREIAGVCSIATSKPVVAAVNGYTEAALVAGDQLGVILLDTDDLIELASRGNIETL